MNILLFCWSLKKKFLLDQLLFEIMKIQICGSMSFAKEMRSAQHELEKLGHSVTIPTNTDLHIQDPAFVEDLDSNLEHCIENDTIRENFKLVAAADGIVVVNYPKNGIDGYVGVSTLMEIGVAHFLEKKIFLLFPIPHFDEHRWAHEVTIMQPVILEGDLRKVR
jgi:hypothetical protein